MRTTVRAISIVALLGGIAYGALLLLEVLLWATWAEVPGGDLRTGPQVVDELRNQGEDAVLYLSPFANADLGQGFPVEDGGDWLPMLSSAGLATTVTCNESGAWGSYVADRYGFNNPDLTWDTVRRPVVILGGGYAQGACAAAATDVGSNLRGTFRSVVNLGQGGATAIAQLAILKEYALPLRPCLAVWLIAEDEALALPEEIQPVLLNYLDPGFRLDVARYTEAKDAQYRAIHEAQYEADAVPAAPLSLAALDPSLLRLPRARLYLSNPARVLVAPRPAPDANSAEADFLRQVLAEAVDAALTAGAETLMVYLPSFAGAVTGRPTALHDVVWNATGDLTADWLDLTPLFAAAPDVKALFAAGHPNHYSEAGYRLVASAITDYLGGETGCALR